MSLLVTSVLVAGGVLVGRWIMKSQQPPKPGEGDAATDGQGGDAQKKDAKKDDEGADVKASGGTKKRDEAKPPAADPFETFVVKLGDVVMRTAGDEAWLAGALVFAEEVPVAALFVAPDAGGDRAIYARPRPNEALVWLEPVAPGSVVTGAEPPTTIEHDGVRFERARRLPVRVSRAGTGGPDMGDRAIVAEYAAAAGERLVVVIGAQTRAWRGAVLEPGMYDVLPSGKSTLE